MEKEKDLDHKNIFKFMLGSLAGGILFLVPVQYDGQTVIGVGIFVNIIQSLLKDYLSYLIAGMIVISTFITFCNTVFCIPWMEQHPALKKMFTTTRFWLCIRIIGAVFVAMTCFGWGTEYVIAAETGGNILFNLLPTCVVWFFAAGMFLPFLTEFGIMDFFGTVMRDIARPLFRIPGRALIDCFSSWIGSGVCGAYLTIFQYETGCYTAREAAVIVTNFSIVGIGMCSAVTQYLDITSVFIPYYITVIIAGIICAVITPRIYPLCRISDTYDEESGKTVRESIPETESKISWGFKLAVERAGRAPSLKKILTNGLKTSLDLIVSTAPVLMALGTFALILSVHTSVFEIIAYPFGLMLKALHVPYAAEAAPAMIIGFADSYLPIFIGMGIPSFYTRFIIGCIAVLQIIYVSEIGTMILTSKIPISLWQLFLVFLERTMISLPIILLFAKIFMIGA